jgi:ABC-type iron transport system FetAB ATPase subunit
MDILKQIYDEVLFNNKSIDNVDSYIKKRKIVAGEEKRLSGEIMYNGKKYKRILYPKYILSVSYNIPETFIDMVEKNVLPYYT